MGLCNRMTRNSKFAGALQGQRARKGIFITTGSFSKEAKEYTNKIDSKIVLIDGKTTNRIYDRQKYRSNFRELLFYKEIRPGQF